MSLLQTRGDRKILFFCSNFQFNRPGVGVMYSQSTLILYSSNVGILEFISIEPYIYCRDPPLNMYVILVILRIFPVCSTIQKHANMN